MKYTGILYIEHTLYDCELDRFHKIFSGQFSSALAELKRVHNQNNEYIANQI